MAVKVEDETAPNPSTITSQTVDRAVANSEAVLNARLDGIEKAFQIFQNDLTRVPTSVDRAILGLREVLEARLNGMDKDTLHIHDSLEKRKADIEDQIKHLHSLMQSKVGELTSVTGERFTGVAAQFSERDTRTDQRAGDTKLAVDAAFAAAKEATSKIEMGFTKSIDGQQELLKTMSKSTDDKIADLKDRLTTIESRTVGISTAQIDNRNERGDSRGMTFGVIGVVVAVAALLVTVLTHVIK